MAFLEEWIIPILVEYGLLAVFITMTLESACIPIPSEIVVPYGGVLAAGGHLPLDGAAGLALVVLVATLANLTGSAAAYGAGRWGGRILVERYGRYVFMSKHHLDVADRWFERRGEATVFLTRMMPGVRTFISVPAGVARMPFARFAIYSFLGAVPWNLALAYLGFVLGQNWDNLQGYFHEYNLVFFAALAVLVAAAVLWKLRSSRRAQRRRQAERSPEGEEA
jgi:membrane protein DedA with SNARE-associated domain